MSVVAEAIEQRRGELFVAEDLDPLGERQIGGDDGRAPFIALGQQIEQQLAAGALERNESQLIDDQQRDFLIALLERGEPPLVARLNQALHQIGGAREVNSHSATRGLDSQGNRNDAIFPVPIGPAKITSSARPMKSQLASSISFGRDTPLSTAQSSWSKVLISGKRASRSRRRAVL